MKPPKPLLLVAQKLGPLRSRVVFVGGMIRGLLTTDPAAGPMRPTDDVDLIVRDVDSLSDYYALGTELRVLGFHEDSSEGAPRCRWIVDGVTTDIMPINPTAMGFTNVWYESAQRHTSTTSTAEGDLHYLDAPHFCATKLEAFASRSGGDHYHHDLEDYVAVVDERATLLAEIAAAPPEVRAFLAERTKALLATTQFIDALPGHLSADEVSQQRLPKLMDTLRRIAALGEQEVSAKTRSTTTAVESATARRPTTPKLAPARSLKWPAPPSPATFPTATSSALHPISVQRVYVQSSNLEWVEYDSAGPVLTIGFHRGGEYAYSGVPAGVYQGLLSAYSKGRYFHVWIRDRYPTSRLR